jgi:hypothetical protein
MAHMLQRKHMERIHKSTFISIVADGTTDMSGKEKFSVILRILNDKLEPEELFLGFYEPPNTTAASLFACLNDVFVRYNISWEKIRGICFDGASNMSGRINGCRTLIQEKQPLALYVHCCNHSLDLALSEEARNIAIIGDTLLCIQEIANCINCSAKRLNIFEQFVIDNNNDANRLLSICPHRWTVRCKGCKRFIENYETVYKTLEKIENDKETLGTVRAKLRGFMKQLGKFETIFGMKLCCVVFEPCEMLAKMLQKPDLSATDAIRGSTLLLDSLKTLRHNDKFYSLLEETKTMANSLNITIKPPTPLKNKKIPIRFQHSKNANTDNELSPYAKLRKTYFETIDLLINQIERRFDQPGLKSLSNLETSLINLSSDGLSHADLDMDLLVAQIKILKSQRNTFSSVNEVKEYFLKEGGAVKELLSEIVRLTEVILIVPLSNASAERSFSCLRRIKTYLRSTMRIDRLNHLSLLAVYREEAQHLILDEILKTFISNKPERYSIFGNVQ